MYHDESKWLLSSESEEFTDELKSDFSSDDDSTENEKINRKYEATLDFNLLQKLRAVHLNVTNASSWTSDQQVKKSGAGEKGSDSDSQSDTVTHCVTMGDTYKRLALRYHTKPCKIKKRNKISKPLKYMIGRELMIPVGKSYTPQDPQQAAGQESLFPALMKAFLLKSEESEVSQTPSYFKGKKHEKARQKMCIAGAAPSTPVKSNVVATSRMRKEFHNQSQIELGPVNNTVREC